MQSNPSQLHLQKTIPVKQQAPSNDFIKKILDNHQSEPIIMRTWQKPMLKHHNFENVLYDAIFLDQTSFLLSCRSMPVRLYQIQQEHHLMNISTFYDKKLNSELFLAPIQFTNRKQKIVGGGKKFLALYDIMKNKCLRIGCMEKKMISTVKFLNQQLLIVGEFSGTINWVDLRQGKNNYSYKVHLDAISAILDRNELQFITSARKDNYKYLWDVRMQNNYLQCYEQELYGNQRIAIQMHPLKDVVYFGTQQGFIKSYAIDDAVLLDIFSPKDLKLAFSVSSMLIVPEKKMMLACVGQRFFQQTYQKQKKAVIHYLSYV